RLRIASASSSSTSSDRTRLRRKREPDSPAPNLDVTTEQRRDAVGPIARKPLRADPEPAERDQPKCDGGNALPIELVLVEMLGHRRAKLRQVLAEPDQPVVLRLLLGDAKIRAVEVLLPPGLVVAGRLELRSRTRRDPDVLPRRRDGEPFDALENRGLT